MAHLVIDLSELRGAAQRAFPADRLLPDREKSWALMVEMGWLLLSIAEEQGGLGLGPDAAATMHFELGRVLSPAPLLPASLALQAIAASRSLADKGAWLERICAGEYIPAPMLPAQIASDADLVISGRVPGVLEADMATHVVVMAAHLVVLVPLRAPAVTLEERPAWDKSRRLFDVTLSRHRCDPALVLAEGENAAMICEAVSASAQLGIAADSLGGANAAFDQTVSYLKIRRQFDRPLAMFQSLKHRCADLKVRLAAAEALMWSRAIDRASSPIAFGGLKTYASEVYRAVAEEAIQMHGGIGLTSEHQCHLFMKRAMLNLQLGEGADVWLEKTGRAALAHSTV